MAMQQRAKNVDGDNDDDWMSSHHVQEKGNAVTAVISWSSYHTQNADSAVSTTHMAMLPLFEDSANSVAIMQHSMDIIKTAVNHLHANIVIMLGGLHNETAALKSSGWVETMVDAGIASPGTGESYLTVSHVRCCRHIHEVTVAVLHCLRPVCHQLVCLCSRSQYTSDSTCERMAILRGLCTLLHRFNIPSHYLTASSLPFLLHHKHCDCERHSCVW